MLIEKRIAQLGYQLPAAGAANTPFVQAQIARGGLVFTSGCTPRLQGQMAYTGKCGAELSIEDSQEAARICLVNCLGAVKSVVGDLDKVEKIVKMTGFVNSTLDFSGQPKVIDGASALLQEIFEEKGAHARSAIGVAGLPGNAACEIELIVQIDSAEDTWEY